MNYRCFIGIDIAKDSFDLCLLLGDQSYSLRIENNTRAIKKVFKSDPHLQQINWKNTLFCMEHTGIYNYQLLDFLFSSNAHIWLENPVHIKRSNGLTRGKNDRIDAQRIAHFACRHHDQAKLWTPQRPVMQQLKHLMAARSRLIKAIKALQTPLAEIKSFTTKKLHHQLAKSCQASLKALKDDLRKSSALITQIILDDPRLNTLFKQIASVPGIGPVVAANMIISTNEFNNFDDPKKFACYAGLAPFEHSSGSSIRGKTRVSHMADKSLKTLLHLAALAAMRIPGELNDYYLRKVAEGKNKMLVINAIRNKLVHRIFACVNQQRLFQKTFAPTA